MKSNIDNLFKIIQAEEGYLLPLKEKVNWIPVLKLDDFYIGILDNENWVVQVREGLYCLNMQKVYVYVIVILEQPFESIREKIITFFFHYKIVVDVDKVFPFVEIIRAGLEQKADYWAELAFKWYDSLTVENKIKLKNTLIDIINAKWASQKIRQKAKKELKKYKTLE